MVLTIQYILHYFCFANIKSDSLSLCTAVVGGNKNNTYSCNAIFFSNTLRNLTRTILNIEEILKFYPYNLVTLKNIREQFTTPQDSVVIKLHLANINAPVPENLKQ